MNAIIATQLRQPRIGARETRGGVYWNLPERDTRFRREGCGRWLVLQADSWKQAGAGCKAQAELRAHVRQIPMMVSRRQFMRGDFKARRTPQRPPWALAEEAFLAACSGCGECLPVCATRIIVVVRGYPEVDFERGECTFCGACAAACKDRALLRAESETVPWLIKAQIADSCLARRGVECRTCGDHCPVAAIRFSPRLGRPPAAEVDAGSCTGCGACVAHCPANAISMA